MHPASDPPRILIVEDDLLTQSLIAATLADSGYRVAAVATLAQARQAMDAQPPALVVLDLGLPDGEGLGLVAQIKSTPRIQPDMPPAVIVITARTQSEAAVASLDIGADDYVRKPFDPAELIARVRAVLRRRAGTTPDQVLAVAGWRLDPRDRRLTAPNQVEIVLTRAEFDLLHALAAGGGRVLSRENLLAAIGSADDATDRTVDVLIGRLRRKLAVAAPRPLCVETVKGLGYRLNFQA